MTAPEVTAVIPVFNGRAALEIAIPRSIEILSGITTSFEIIVAEDGSKDGSAEFVLHYGENDPRVLLLHSDERQGRGKALNRAIREAKGDIVCYYDVDLATDMQHLQELIDIIRRGADAATGSRLLPTSDTQRTGGRTLASRGYNFLVRTILASRLYDHQYGFKAFNRQRILSILPLVRSDHWFWDTELLVRSQLQGYTVREFPVRWHAGKGTTVKAKDVFEMGTAILRLWWQIHVQET
jgi:glycosyltransferase involved in cell wall biosynthesis